MMPFVETIQDVVDNIRTIERYLNSENDQERNFAVDLVRRGRTIMVYEINGESHFAPSRFLGYKKNTMMSHLENEEKDGRDTNPVIDALAGKAFSSQRLEQIFLDYCRDLGATPSRNKRQYWRSKDEQGKYLKL